MDQMFLELQSCPKYNKYLQLMQILQPEIDRWNKVSFIIICRLINKQERTILRGDLVLKSFVKH